MIIDCRQHLKRTELTETYDITPLIYSVVLNGQQKTGCCDTVPLSGHYFGFEYKHRFNPLDTGVFFVGEHCGFDFIEILKTENFQISTPVFFNPYQSFSEKHMKKITANGLISDTYIKMTPLNKELFIAINLISIAWNKVPYGNLSSILSYCAIAKRDTQDWAVNSVNRIIGKDIYKRTLLQIYQELQDKYKIRNDYTFHNLNDVINKNGWLNYIY